MYVLPVQHTFTTCTLCAPPVQCVYIYHLYNMYEPPVHTYAQYLYNMYITGTTCTCVPTVHCVSTTSIAVQCKMVTLILFSIFRSTDQYACVTGTSSNKAPDTFNLYIQRDHTYTHYRRLQFTSTGGGDWTAVCWVATSTMYSTWRTQ